MGFFKELDEAKQPPNRFDVGAANHLYKALVDKNLIRKAPNLEGWANHIKLLRTADGVPPKRVKQVLQWYTRHLGETYLPVAHSTEGFRKKFNAIAQAAKQGPGTKERPISEEARTLVKDMGLYWPPHITPADVLYVVQGSLTAYADYRAGLQRVANEGHHGPHGQLSRLAAHIRRAAMPYPKVYVQGYMEAEVHVMAWDMWRKHEREVNLRNHVWRPQRKHYAETAGRAWAAEFTGFPEHYDRLLELL